MQTSITASKRLETRKSRTNFTLLDQANQLRKCDLRALCRAYRIPIDQKATKTVFAQALSNYILENAGTLLSQLDLWDLETIRKLVRIGPGRCLVVELESCSTILFQTMLIRVIREDEAEYCLYVMSDDLRLAIGPQADAILEDKIYRKKVEIHQFVQGLKTLYGAIQIGTVRAALLRFFPRTEEYIDLISKVAPCPENTLYSTPKKEQTEKILFYSPSVLEEFDNLDQFLEVLDDRLGNKIFSFQEIVDAGHRPYPVFHCEEAQRMKEYLCEELGFESELIDSSMYGLWIESQSDSSDFIQTVFLTGKYFRAETKIEWYKIYQFVKEFLDATPRWSLKGYSRNEWVRLMHNDDRKELDRGINGAKDHAKEFDLDDEESEDDGDNDTNLQIHVEYES